MKKIINIGFVLIFVFAALVTIFVPCGNAYASEIPSFSDIGDLFFPSPTHTINEKVYLSGKPIGISIEGEGVVVIGINEFVSAQGVVSPASKAGLTLGDIIVSVNDQRITSTQTLLEIVAKCEGNALEFVVKRGGKFLNFTLQPCIDVMSNNYKLGVWIRDAATGIGTLTYIRKNLQFGSLGHPILSADTNEIAKVSQGAIFDCTINGVVKGERGKAGELRGSFDFKDKIGRLYINNKYGAYGNMDKLPDNFSDNMYSVAAAHEVKPGNVKILTTINGDTPKEYDAEILKVVPQTSLSDKGIVLRITDTQLLEITGGIVQGMSGSPIIQNGRFVGAITHVFVNDPTKGYGILAQWMLEN